MTSLMLIPVRPSLLIAASSEIVILARRSQARLIEFRLAGSVSSLASSDRALDSSNWTSREDDCFEKRSHPEIS